MSADDNVFERLTALGFRSDKDTLRSMLEALTKARASPIETCEKLFALEHRERDRQNLDRRTQAATLGDFKTLERFDWNHPKSVDRDLYERLHGLDFIERAENILFRGTAGLGKTTLAQNLGLAALHKGHTVRFTTLAEALAELLKQESIPAFERRLRRYTQVDLLVLDEIGYLACDTRAADLLYNIISRRHEKRSTIITTNLPFKQWPSIFPGAACVVAMVDRFVQHCHVMDIEGESWRPKDSEPPPKRARARARSRRH
jgi:DNA replication protein DnaC